MTSVKLAFYARVALVLHGIALVLLFMYLGRTIIIPLFFAFLISILLEPLAKWLEKRRIPRGIAAIFSLLIFIIVIGGLVYFFSSQVARFTKDLPHLEQRIAGQFQSFRQWLAEEYHVNDDAQIAYMEKSANGVVGAVAGRLATTFVGVAEFLILTIFFLVFTFFMLYHRKLLTSFLIALFSSNHNKRVKTVLTEVRLVIKSYVIGLLTEMAILIVLIFTTLWFLGIKYALLMSVMAAVLNIIPYLGIYTAMALSVLITLANGTGGDALTIAIVFIIAHFVDANVILPRIVGGRVKLNPLITIIAVLIGHLLWGVPGMFLFIPLTAIIRIVSEEVDDLAPWAILIGEEKKGQM
ncbi:MAG: AI-2E family transporter [Bacteroidetes bacterium]|nr:AI-2E family transporter [Bacteroidota bacterium]